MDHKDQHHEHHRAEREREKREKKEHDRAVAGRVPPVRRFWLLGLGIALVIAAVFVWTFVLR